MGWMESLEQGVAQHHWGDYASIVGLAVAVIGFGVTYVNVVRSRKAAEQAEAAVASLREKQQLMDVARDLSLALAIMDEVKRLNREKSWVILIDRYSVLKRTLILVKASDIKLTQHQRFQVQGTIQQVATIEDQIECVVDGKEEAPSVPQLNKVISRQMDSLIEIIAEIRNSLSEEPYGRRKNV